MYQEEDYLQLSGIQHFLFCRRQWALIHLEQQWADNVRTTEGELLHKNAHDETLRTRRGDQLTVHAVKIHSAKLGFSGECDVLELHESEGGITLENLDGLWQPYPVEYKKGAPKNMDCDRAQLCAQVICLEEMLCCDIPEVAIFYAEPRRREVVEITKELRTLVEETAAKMHQMYRRGTTPKVKPSRACNACSLKELCLPKLMRAESVTSYMRREGGIAD